MHVASKNEELIDKDRKELEQKLMPLFTELDKYAVPDDKIQTIIKFTVDYYGRNKHMKFARIIKKVVEEFHLRLR